MEVSPLCNQKEFEALIKENQFYEYAKIYENYYGTLKNNVDQTIKITT